MSYPVAVLLVKCKSPNISEMIFDYLRSFLNQFNELLNLVITDPSLDEGIKLQYFGLDGEVNPISGNYEVAKELLSKLDNDTQQKLYEELHKWGHKIY